MKFLIIVLALSSSVGAQESYHNYHREIYSRKYTVKKGDTLSQILKDHGFKGIYKNTQSKRNLNPLNLVKWQNGFKVQQLHKLEVGQVIFLPPGRVAKRKIATQGPVEIEDLSYKVIKKNVEQMSRDKAGSSWF